MSYKLGMEFIDQGEDFAFGFECGRLWEQLKVADAIQQHVHAENSAQIIMMCDHHQRNYKMEDMGSGWLNLIVPAKTTPTNDTK